MSHYTNNLHRIFVDREIGFKKEITPTELDLDFFNNVKKVVKSHLKTKIKEFLEQQGLASITPKFRIQGSWAYGTCNLPAKQGQEMDFDYGVYLPVRAFDGFNPDAGASEQAKNYFEQVELMMGDLCEQHDWLLDTSAPSSCIRIKIRNNAHMDIPLYAVPDDMFDSLEERNELQVSLGSATAIHESLNYSKWVFEDFNIRSFAEDLKAWRDWQFADKSFQPSSILLMIIACKYYQYYQHRDDLALLSVLEKLPNALSGNVYENIEEHESEDFNRMKEGERVEAMQYADALYQNFMASLNNFDKTKALKFITNEWGNRIPQDEDLIETSRQAIFDTPPLVQPNITPQAPLRQG